MRDDPVSRYIRKAKGLPDNWRVFSVELVKNGVRLTGSLVRAADPIYEAYLHRDFDWIRPMRGKRTMALSHETYTALLAGERGEPQPPAPATDESKP